MLFYKIKNLSFVVASLVFATLLASITFLAPVAQAADVPDYRLQISPTQVNLGELEPGKTYTGSFRVQNTGQQAYSFETDVAPYTVTNESYEPNLTIENKYTLLRDWITIEGGEAEVQPGEQKEVKYSITIPANAPAGNQNAALTVTMLDDSVTSASGVKTVQQAAFIMYSNVAGTTVRTGEILENKVPSFLFEPPVVATSKVENSGNIYTVAHYLLEVKEFFGDKVVYTNADDANGQIIFPETERYNEVTWENAPQLGIFKVKQTITIFDEENTIEKLVFLCPIWFLVVIIAFVAILIFMIVGHILRRRDR